MEITIPNKYEHDFSNDYIKNVDVIGELNNKLCRKMAKNKDDILKIVLDKYFVKGWCLNDIKERCLCIINSDETEMYSADGKELVKFYPPEFKVYLYKQKMLQKYKILI
jgi:hypothetical protein